ncbi:MAG: LamG domain-containing protein [Myxococcota bacterium]|nr:LamG domain-containing protein [Deltaproteobacteria bacterium]MDQ3335642.1 LamG domain-containing protein [Myxococcota bacterium]
MRRLALLLGLVVASCSVPDKNPSTTDAGMDAPLPVDDDAVPETFIVEAPKEFSGTGSATFKFTANYANAMFECSIDGEVAQPCSSPYTRALGDGSHNFSVRAINKNGKGDATPAEHLWMIDTVAPNTMLTEAPPSADNSTMVRFSFRSSEENVTYDCSLDGNTYVACNSGTDFGPVADGSHSFAVRAIDRAGNVDSSPAIHAWSVDTSTPDTQLLSGPEGAVATNTATFTFVSPDAGAGASFQCSLDGGAMVACASPYTLNNLPMGAHTFQVRVRDAVGNFDPTPSTRTWTVDLDPPQTTIDSGPSGMVRVASASFTFSANEVNVVYTCSLDGSPMAACTSPQNFANLGQGSHTFSVTARDAAGHVDPTPATRTWTVDTIAPDLMITAGPAEAATVGPRVVFSFTASEGTVECAFDAGGFAPCSGSIAANLSAGPHTFRLTATDQAGNVTTVTRSFTVACAAPTSTGAAGLLRLDDSGQVLANATGGANAVLGTNDMVEVVDPGLGAGKFGGAAAFSATEGDRIAWPAALGAMPNLSVELWARPDSLSGGRDLFVSGDGALAIRVTAVTATTVRISASVNDGAVRMVQSAPVAAGAWHHIVVSSSAAGLRLWVDGLRTEVAATAAPVLDAITLGGNYSGALDEIWVSASAITDDETALARYCP